MLLIILRYLRGYVRFTVRGKYPERFINITLRNKLRIWDVVRRDSGMTACMYMRDYLSIRRYARGSGVRLRVLERRGMPTILRRYSDRVGLVIGAAAFVMTVFVMSLFIWSIDITGIEGVSESEMRSMLAENGVYIGAFKPAVDYQSVSRSIMLSDQRIGWLAVNVTGSYASVEVKEQTPLPDLSEANTPCNVKALRDGTIVSISAEQGVTTLKEGSGVVEGQVVVSGVMEDLQGGVRLVHAKAEVIAQTDYHADFSLPQKIMTFTPTGEVKERLTADLFGLKLPLTIGGVSTVDVLTDELEEAPDPLDVKLPASVITSKLYALERRDATLNNNTAKELLTLEARLYEVFTLSDCTVTDRKYRLSDSPDGYTFTADFTCREDIAYEEEIYVSEEREVRSEE